MGRGCTRKSRPRSALTAQPQAPHSHSLFRFISSLHSCLSSFLIDLTSLTPHLTLPSCPLENNIRVHTVKSTMATTAAGRMLSRQLQQMQSDKDIPGISCGLVDSNLFEWEVMLMISDDVKLYGGRFPASPLYLFGEKRREERDRERSNADKRIIGGFFRARLSFPPEYPHMPPKMKFEPAIFHPNGMQYARRVCSRPNLTA